MFVLIYCLFRKLDGKGRRIVTANLKFYEDFVLCRALLRLLRIIITISEYRNDRFYPCQDSSY
jgi:hypothetical protein